jgi:(R)-amidase
MDPTVAACQIRVDDLDGRANLDRVAERVRALPGSVDVAVFPELALTGFVADDRVVEAALRTDGPELDRIRDLAGENGLAIVIGYAEAADGAVHNATAYVAPDGTTAVYRKRHLWGGETSVFAPGGDLVTVETPVGLTGLATCYDLNFVHDSAAFTDERADALFVPGAWPATHGANWRLLARARALDGVRWVVACGRTGRREVPDARVTEYAGRSLVVRPDGGVTGELAVEPDTLVETLDRSVLERQRETVGVFHDNN